jgi:hypothetical protein
LNWPVLSALCGLAAEFLELASEGVARPKLVSMPHPYTDPVEQAAWQIFIELVGSGRPHEAAAREAFQAVESFNSHCNERHKSEDLEMVEKADENLTDVLAQHAKERSSEPAPFGGARESGAEQNPLT